MQTISFTNPKCMKCPKNDTCNNKTMICAYIDDENLNSGKLIGDATIPLATPLKITPEMIQKEITKKMLEINIGIDNASLTGLRK